VRAKPGSIPNELTIDISGLTIGDALRVSDLTLPEGVETDVDAEEAVVLGQAPQAVELPEEAEAAEGEEGEAVEGEGAPEAEGEAPTEAPSEGGGEE